MTRSLRPLAIFTLLTMMLVGLSSGLMAQRKPKLKIPVKKLSKPAGERLFKGKRPLGTQASTETGRQLCSPNKLVSSDWAYFSRCPSGKSCPPSPLENCRQVEAVCENSNGGGHYNATGAADCLPAPEPKAPEEVLTR